MRQTPSWARKATCGTRSGICSQHSSAPSPRSCCSLASTTAVWPTCCSRNHAPLPDRRQSLGVTTYVALLRGINVGGHKAVAMADLRHLLTQLGLADARSLLQRGHPVFGTNG